MKPRKKCLKLEEVLELVLDDSDDCSASDLSENSADELKIKAKSSDFSNKPEPEEENVNTVNDMLDSCKSKNNEKILKNCINIENKKDNDSKFHLKNLFHFIENEENDYKMIKENNLFVIDDTSDEEATHNEEFHKKSPIIDLLYPLKFDVNHKKSKKRKRQI